MSDFRNCESFSNLPVKFDFSKLVASFKQEVKEQEVEITKSPRDFLTKPNNDWAVLPMFKYHLDHLKPSLSCSSNNYMRCRFTQFIANAPDSFVTIALYDTTINNMPKPRRKSLNGQFYGVDYKLAPIPVSADPRARSVKPKHTSR